MRYEESFKRYCVNLVVKEGRTQADLEKRQQELEKENKLLKKENDFLKKRLPSLPRTKIFKILIYLSVSSRIWY